MKFRIPRPSAALIVASLALLIAMTGSAVAVVQATGGDSLIKQRTLSGNRLRYNTVTNAEVANLQWNKLTLINGWENANGTLRPPAWAIDAQGIVHLRGAVKNGESSSFARLPLAVRPSAYIFMITSLCDGAERAPGRIVIDPTGYVQADYYNSFADAICLTSLDGVTWAK